MSTTIVNDQPRSPGNTGRVVGLIVLLVLIGAGVWAYFATRPKPVVVVLRDIVGAVPINGSIVVPANAQAVVYAPYRAPVEKIEKPAGSNVNKGDVILELSFPNVEAALAQAKQNLHAAETAYANASRQYDAPVAAAQKQLAAARAAARSAVSSSAPPTGEVNDSSAPTTAAAPTAGSPDIASLEQQVALAQADRRAGLAPYRQQLDAARQAYEEARSGKKLAMVRAPITGTITELDAQPGQEIGVDQKAPVARIVDLSAIQVQAQIDPSLAASIRPGMPVKLTFNQVPGKQFEGKVTSLTAQTESKAAGLVKEQKVIALIDFKNARATVKPGMVASGTIETGAARNALAVPAEAIERDNAGRTIVKVQQNGNWQNVPVQVGVSDGRYTQIKSGLRAGQVVAAPSNLVSAATR